jgi:hypothetical protein
MSIFASGLGSAPVAYREGDILVIPSGATLPPNCVKCNAPVAGGYLRKTFRWHSLWLYVLIFFGVFLYFIIALIVQKKSKLEIPFCQKHRSWRTRMYLAGSFLLIGWIPVLLVMNGFDIDGAKVALICIAMAFSGLVILGTVGMSLAPVYIDEMRTELKGAGEEFLDSLPMQTRRYGLMEP